MTAPLPPRLLFGRTRLDQSFGAVELLLIPGHKRDAQESCRGHIQGIGAAQALIGRQPGGANSRNVVEADQALIREAQPTVNGALPQLQLIRLAGNRAAHLRRQQHGRDDDLTSP